MRNLSLVYAPNKIFKQIAAEVEAVNDDIRLLIDHMFELLYAEKAFGIAANMVGLLKRIIVIDLSKNKQQQQVLINPQIIWQSEETQTIEEASLCFPGISALITRPRHIKVKYIDYEGSPQEIEAEGLYSTVIQHELDYLNGKVFLDRLSKLKRDMLLKKMDKFKKKYPPHVHSKHCQH